MSVLSGEQASKYVLEGPFKVNPNGIDVGVGQIWKINNDSEVLIHGKIRESNIEKQLIQPVGDFYNLERGIYEVRLSAKVTIPKNTMALIYPRSTFNRLGMVKVQSAVGDSGYTGFMTQTIYIPIKKLKVHKDEYWFQICFYKAETNQLYDGYYQDES